MIISKNFLNSIAQSYKITEDSQKSILSENKNYFFESGHTDINRNYDIFLSHSYLDKVHVLALVKLFNIHQFSVYVDWLEDNQLNREDVNVHTANLLRNRMKHSKCLSYLTTENITKSKWCPWEIGYFDGLKQSKCCILPVMEYGCEFNGQEYLGLYPYLEYASFAGVDAACDFYICNQNRTEFIKLRDWIKGSTKYYKGILV